MLTPLSSLSPSSIIKVTEGKDNRNIKLYGSLIIILWEIEF